MDEYKTPADGRSHVHAKGCHGRLHQLSADWAIGISKESVIWREAEARH